MASRSRSPDEGEILEPLSNKATTPPHHVSGAEIDRRNRNSPRVSSLDGAYDERTSLRQKDRRLAHRSRSPNRSHRPERRTSQSRSPFNERRSRSRSPYRPQHTSLRNSHSRSRSPRGAKRRRDDDHYAPRDRRDDRRSFHVHYEDRSDNGPGQDSLRKRSLERSKPRDRREAPRSRSPPRFSDKRQGQKDKRRDRPEGNNTQREGPASKQDVNVSRGDKDKDTASDGASKPIRSVRWALPDNAGESDASVSELGPDVEPKPELDQAALIEQRRKRREAIKAKHRSQASPMMMQALNVQSPETASGTPVENGTAASSTTTPTLNTPADSKASSAQVSRETSRQASPASFELLKDTDMANGPTATDDGPSAADYDPTVDMAEDAERATHGHGDVPATAYDETADEKKDILVTASQPPEKVDNEFDMFAEGADEDMFGAPTGATQGTNGIPVPTGKALDLSMLDDVDDAEGYYKIILGELLDGRYAVQTNLGRGMFSAVVRAMDQTTGGAVAIKIIRANETMRKAAAKELTILANLNSADSEDHKHMIRLHRSFEHKGHLCMVFESLSINLREVLKKFGRDVGINLHAVRAYARQMFLALTLLKKCNILHADLKPDNILVNENRTSLKVCDLGSASDAGDSEITPYLVSRFYRAPEIILGMPLDFALDMWSVGCTLFELYTGKILFTGRSNNQMLKSIMECRGKIPTRSLKKAQLAGLHFEADGSFRSMEREKNSGREVARVLPVVKPTRDLRQRVLAAAGGKEGKTGDEARELNLFVDLLDKCLTLHPDRRISPAEALKHPFLLRSETKHR